MDGKRLAGVRQGHRAGGAVEQPCAQLFFQPGNQRRQGRLRSVELQRSLAEIARLAQGQKGPEVFG
ncbi:hypothetical protein D3C79_1102060 [compost metagenome]